MMRLEFEDKCPYCGQPVIVEQDDANALIGDPSFVLIADWVYHTACWDKQVEDCPP